jgi:hypothetical protein
MHYQTSAISSDTGEKGNKQLKIEIMNEFSSHPLYRIHNIDSAMNSLWEFYKKHFLQLFLISFVMSMVTQYASTFIDLKDIQSETDPFAILDKMKLFLIPMIVISLVNLLFTSMLQHYVIYSPVDSNNSIVTSVFKSFRYYIPYLITIIILSFAGAIAIVLGLFVLVVGAVFAVIYVMTLYLFILPVMMVEGPDIGNTITRVFSLTHRNFWANFGWVATFIIILIVISLILSGIVLLPFAGSFFKTIFKPVEATAATDMMNNPVFFILTSLVNALTMPLMPIFACILYFNGKAGEDQAKVSVQSNGDTGSVRVEDLYAKPYSDDHPDNPEKSN